MRGFKGFATRKEATAYRKERARQKKRKGWICGKNGPLKADYRDCVLLGRLDPEKYPYAVVWNESM